MEKDPKMSYDFSQASHSGEPGFDPYQNEKNEKFYFLFNDQKGVVFLFSQAFDSMEERDHSIREVIAQAGQAANYQKGSEEGGRFFILNAPNGRELARSRIFEAEDEMEAALDYLKKNAPTYSKQYPALSTSGKSVNEYDFSQPSVSGQEGFDIFRSPKNRLYYFHFNDENGKPLLLSEAYSSPRARQNGLRSVIEHAALEENYSILPETKGYFLTLKAKNHQEIARSQRLGSESEARQLLEYLVREIPTYRDQFEEETASPVDRSLTSTPMNEQPNTPLKPGDDEYDLTQPSQSGEKGFERFLSEKNNEFYFHFNEEDGQALFYSEGYKSDKSRDNGVRSVIKNSVKKAHFSDKKDEEGLFFTLRAGNYQEIGRSRYFESEDDLAAAKDWFMKSVHHSAEEFGIGLEVPEHLKAAPLARVLGKAIKGGDDDYDLEQSGSSSEAGFDAFHSEKNKQHYFHFNGEDGQPLFYSEGYQNDKSRNNGVRSVIKNSVVEEHFAVKEDENGKFFSLRAGNYQEIGRSKYFDSEEELLAAKAWFMKNVHKSAAAFGVSGLVVPAFLGGEKNEGEKEKATSIAMGTGNEDVAGEDREVSNDYDKDGVPDPIEHKTASLGEASVGTASTEILVEEKKERRRMPWWLWLILGILLILLLLFLLRGCEGSPYFAGGDEVNHGQLPNAPFIRLGKMGTLEEALKAGYLDKELHSALASGEMGKDEVDWLNRLNGEKLVAAGLMTQAEWDAVKAGELEWDWMQMRPTSEVFGGMGGLLAAKNDNYLDLETYDSLLLGDLLLENMDLSAKLSPDNLDNLVNAGILPAGARGQLKQGQEGWNAIMSANNGSMKLQLGAWGGLDELVKAGVITQAVRDSLLKAGSIDLDKFDWEKHIDLQAAAASGMITTTLIEKLDRGEARLDWPNMKLVPLGTGAESSATGRGNREAELTPIPTFGPFGFAKNADNMLDRDLPNIDKLVSFLKKNSDFTLRVIGHTDSDGEEAYNVGLARKRAQSVKSLLTGKGIPAERINTESAGESSPKVSNETESGKAKNRRVEIEINRK